MEELSTHDCIGRGPADTGQNVQAGN
jgi:hypothetical protein